MMNCKHMKRHLVRVVAFPCRRFVVEADSKGTAEDIVMKWCSKNPDWWKQEDIGDDFEVTWEDTDDNGIPELVSEICGK